MISKEVDNKKFHTTIALFEKHGVNNKKMNKWKISFFVCLGTLISIVVFEAYIIIDQAVSLSYLETGYSDTAKDLSAIIEIINSTDFSKAEIKRSLENGRSHIILHFEGDTVSLNKVSIIFKNKRLHKIIGE